MKPFNLLFLCLALVSCNSMEPALSISNSPYLENLEVKGRQGLLINQKLSFGEFATSKVKRSWTKGSDVNIGLPFAHPINASFPDIFSIEFSDRHQTFSFQMTDLFGNEATVFGASEFESENLRIGNDPNSLINISQDIFGIAGNSENFFYLQLFLNNDAKPWELILDNDASQLKAASYQGIFSVDKERFYLLKPITEILSKKGPRKILMGSIGYEIFNSKNESVAAVALMDSGNVYLHTTDPQERFLMANLCAALLLQQNIAE